MSSLSCYIRTLRRDEYCGFALHYGLQQQTPRRRRFKCHFSFQLHVVFVSWSVAVLWGGGMGGEEGWEGLEAPQTFSAPPPGICLADKNFIPSKVRLHPRSIETFHDCLHQPEFGLKTSISQQWSTGSLSDGQA